MGRIRSPRHTTGSIEKEDANISGMRECVDNQSVKTQMVRRVRAVAGPVEPPTAIKMEFYLLKCDSLRSN